ncbi:hypothetical protein AVEN_173194-1, partial [Araneus ventricosus]
HGLGWPYGKPGPDLKNATKKAFKTGLECGVDDPPAVKYGRTMKCVIDDQDPCDDEEEPSDNDRAEKGASIEEAFRYFETAMKWLQQQEECDVVQWLVLKRVRDLAPKKRSRRRF